MSETPIVKETMIEASKLGLRLFRNNTGMGWAGHPIYKPQEAIKMTVYPGDVLVRNARALHAGLCTGSSDTIGFTPVVITPEMVGKTIAIFTAVECKTQEGKASEEQRDFLSMVKLNGGIAILLKNAKELKVKLSESVEVTKRFFSSGEFVPITKCKHGKPKGLCNELECADKINIYIGGGGGSDIKSGVGGGADNKSFFNSGEYVSNYTGGLHI